METGMPQTPGSAVQSEIEELERRLHEKRQELENKGKKPHPKEALHEVVREKIVEHKNQTVKQQKSDDDDDDGNGQTVKKTKKSTEDGTPSYELPQYKEKVKELVADALSGNLSNTIKDTLSKDDPALLDAFHDVLVDELYEHFVSQGKIDKIE